MYRGSHPSYGSTDRDTPVSDGRTTSAMLADMNRLPGIPSRPGPRQTFSNWGSYHHRPEAASSRPEIVPPTQRPRDPEGSSSAPQLPSLRTLLQPQLLETKLPSPQLSSGNHFPPDAPSRFESSSPTLKRRHESGDYSHERSESDASSSRAPNVLRHVHSAAGPESQAFSTPGSTPGSRASDFSRHHRQMQSDTVGKIHRPPSTVSSMSVSSDPTIRTSVPPSHEDPMDIVRNPMKRRVDMTQRAPVRASQCVGQREVPGEGLCYVYEDGSYCRAIIDGEPVNPSWGITKAGKPRKRLAQACLTCREKKIKCEPAFPKCNQCAKSQRVCRGGLNQPSTSNASDEPSPPSTSVPFSSRSSEHISPVSMSGKARMLDESKTTLPAYESARKVESWNHSASPSKRLRHFTGSVTSYRDMSVHSLDTDYSNSLNDPESSIAADQLALAWDQDPFETDRTLTLHLLELYFTHAGRATYGIFPEEQFLAWVQTCRDKSPDDRMLLYSLLAMGSIFSRDQERRSAGRQFASIAAHATEKRFGRFSLQLCQSRLMLALYNFARGRATEAWDFCGGSLRAISALRLNTEEGVREFGDDIPLDFGFDRRTLEECCRRTFWSGFLMDRYNGFCGGTLCVINPEDTFLYLPCPEGAFWTATQSETPFFDFDLLSRNAPPGPPLGFMAQMTLISAIWGEVLTYTSRAVHRADTGYERHYEAFYDKTHERLDTWISRLPPYLHYTPQNLDTSIMEGYAGTFVSIHALYHTTCIRLNRHARARALSPQNLRRNIMGCFHHASQFLTIMQHLDPSSGNQRLPPGPGTSNFSFSTPFPGYALMLVVDVLSSGGATAHLPNLIKSLGSSVGCVEELGEFWASARAQHKAISSRLNKLADMAFQDRPAARGPFWRLGHGAMETSFGKDDDVVYGTDERAFYDVLSQISQSNGR